MRKLSLDETWDYTKRMWKWIAIQKEIEGDERHVIKLKKVWLEENAPEFVEVKEGCFFCAARAHEGECKTHCPASLVDGPFDCQREGRHYADNPGAFYREILRLDAIRMAEPVVVGREWKHGDVFKRRGNTLMICVVGMVDKMHIFCVDLGDHCCCGVGQPVGRGHDEEKPSILSDPATEFLFNVNDITIIKDKL